MGSSLGRFRFERDLARRFFFDAPDDRADAPASLADVASLALVAVFGTLGRGRSRTTGRDDGLPLRRAAGFVGAAGFVALSSGFGSGVVTDFAPGRAPDNFGAAWRGAGFPGFAFVVAAGFAFAVAAGFAFAAIAAGAIAPTRAQHMAPMPISCLISLDLSLSSSQA